MCSSTKRCVCVSCVYREGPLSLFFLSLFFFSSAPIYALIPYIQKVVCVLGGGLSLTSSPRYRVSLRVAPLSSVTMVRLVRAPTRAQNAAWKSKGPGCGGGSSLGPDSGPGDVAATSLASGLPWPPLSPKSLGASLGPLCLPKALGPPWGPPPKAPLTSLGPHPRGSQSFECGCPREEEGGCSPGTQNRALRAVT